MAVRYDGQPRSRLRIPMLGLLAALAVMVLAFALDSVFQWKSNAGDANSLTTAPSCGRSHTADCTERVRASVVAAYQQYSYGINQNYVTLLGANGRDLPAVELTGGTADAQALPPGTLVTAVLWRGRIVSLATPAQPAIQTGDDPATQADSFHMRSMIAGAILLILLVAMAVWTLTWRSAAERVQSRAN